MKYHSLEEIRKQKVVFATQDNQYYYYRLEPESRFDSIIWRIQKLTGKVDTIHMTEYFKVEDGTRPITKPPDELKHYGIPGMRWGVRNGPPYPLDQQSHNKVVSGKSGSRSGSSNSKSDTKRGYAPLMLSQYSNGFTHWWLHATPEERRAHQKAMRKIILGEKKLPELKTIPKLNRRDSVKQAVKKANPHFDQEDGGGKYNCTNVAIAMALRMQGYKVAAKPILEEAQIDPRKYYKDLIKNYHQCHNGVYYKEGSQKEAEGLIKKILDGDKNGFGAITCYWKEGGGHIFNWVARDGKITFVDGQTGNADCGELYFKHVLPTAGNKAMYDDVFRLDKAIWKEDMLRKAIEVG